LFLTFGPYVSQELHRRFIKSPKDYRLCAVKTLGDLAFPVAAAPGAFLSAAVWGGQRGGQICIWEWGQEFRMTMHTARAWDALLCELEGVMTSLQSFRLDVKMTLFESDT